MSSIVPLHLSRQLTLPYLSDKRHRIMSDAIILLQMEHRQAATLLDSIDQQLSNIVGDAPVNYHLLQSAFEYLSGYPDQCHHPKEDLIYRKLHSRYPELARSLSDLVNEHAKLATLTGNVSKAIDQSQQGLSGAHDRLAGELKEFLALYRHHMLMEEQYFFPMATRALTSVVSRVILYTFGPCRE